MRNQFEHSIDDYRLYTWCNFYLSPIQQGIQTAHVVGTLLDSYARSDLTPHVRHVIETWADTDKTIIVCNGGNNKMMGDSYQLALEFADRNDLPEAVFFEDDQSLGCLKTAFGIILPKCIYTAEKDGLGGYTLHHIDDSYQTIYPTHTDYQFIDFLRTSRLA